MKLLLLEGQKVLGDLKSLLCPRGPSFLLRVIGAIMFLPFCAFAQTLPPVQTASAVDANTVAARSTNYAITAHGGNHRVWQKVFATHKDDQGQIIYRTNSYTEMATGMYHLVGTNWVESTENIQITQTGGVATNGRHQVGFAGNLNTSNAVEVITPDGKELRTHILGLAYYDASTSNSVLFAELRDSIGQVVRSNQVVYTNAFSNLQADVRYTYRRSGFEQDVVFRQQLPNPSAFGMSSNTTRLQVWTEFLDPPTPSVKQLARGADVQLDFGTMKMGRGKAFVIGNESNSVPVNKQWVTIQGRTFLVEQVPFSAVAAKLQNLPAPGNN